MLTRSPMTRLLLLLCSVFGLIAVPDCWGAARSIAPPGEQLQLVLPGQALEVGNGSHDVAGATLYLSAEATPADETDWLEYAVPDLQPDTKASGISAYSSSSMKLLLKRYSQKLGIPAHVAAGFEGIKYNNDHEIDDALVGGLIGVASSYVFAEPLMGWQVKAEGNTRNVSLNFRLAW